MVHPNSEFATGVPCFCLSALACPIICRITCLFAKQPAHSAQNTVLLGVVRVVLARNFENGRESSSVGIDSMSYAIGNLFFQSAYVLFAQGFLPAIATDVLVDEDDANVLPRSEGFKGRLDRSGVRLAIHHQEVLFLVGARADVL